MPQNKTIIDTEKLEDLEYDIKVAVYKVIRKHQSKLPKEKLLGCIYRTIKEVLSHD